MNTSEQNFGLWLKEQEERQDSIGRFARYVKMDSCWPRDDDYVALRNHIRGGHEEILFDLIADFELAWEEYQLRTQVLVHSVPIVGSSSTITASD